MQIAILSDIYKLLRQVAMDVKGAGDIPRKHRAELLDVVNDTYQMLDKVILTVIGRIERVLDRAERGDREEFASELRKIQYSAEWLDSTREMSLSSGLRRVHREQERVAARLLNRVAIRDWKSLQNLMLQAMHEESGLSMEIATRLADLSDLADGVTESDKGFVTARKALEKARRDLQKQRRRLLTDEMEFYSVI